MTEIRSLKNNGDTYYPLTHKKAVRGLEGLNINDNGFFLISENGKKWQLIADDNGKLSTTEIPEGVKK